MCRHELVCRKADQIIATFYFCRVNSQPYLRWLCLIRSPFSYYLISLLSFLLEVYLSISLASSEMLCPVVVRALFNSPISSPCSVARFLHFCHLQRISDSHLFTLNSHFQPVSTQKLLQNFALPIIPCNIFGLPSPQGYLVLLAQCSCFLFFL